MTKKYRSLFDIIGPVMVGPSSSHTAGAVYIGRFARKMYPGKISKAGITFYGSFAHTYRGHGTDVAVISGLLGLTTYDPRIPSAYELAVENKLDIEIHVSDEPVANPNTARIDLDGTAGEMTIVGVSIGGGTIEIININGFPCHLNGELPTILTIHQDQFGIIAQVSNIIASQKINVAHMEVSRHEKGRLAMMIIETDERLSEDLLAELRDLPAIKAVLAVDLAG